MKPQNECGERTRSLLDSSGGASLCSFFLFSLSEPNHLLLICRASPCRLCVATTAPPIRSFVSIWTRSGHSEDSDECSCSAWGKKSVHPKKRRLFGLELYFAPRCFQLQLQRQKCLSVRPSLLHVSGPNQLRSLVTTFTDRTVTTPFEAIDGNLSRAREETRVATNVRSHITISPFVSADRQNESGIRIPHKSGARFARKQSSLRSTTISRVAFSLCLPRRPTIAYSSLKYVPMLPSVPAISDAR